MKTIDVLEKIEAMVDAGLDEDASNRILTMMGAAPLPPGMLAEARLWTDFLPRAPGQPYSPAQRFMHFLFEAVDGTPMGAAVNFAIPFRRIMGKGLFKRLGKNFICDKGCTFNCGNNLDIDDDVMINRGCFLDATGGIRFGTCSTIAESVRIFTRTHSESDHTLCEFKPVVIGDYAQVHAGAIILPDVKIGEQAIVAAGAVVTKDVPPNTFVSGNPAKVMRLRETGGRRLESLRHFWLKDRAFQRRKWGRSGTSGDGPPGA